MRSLPVGALVAAIVMFALGFVFYGILGMTAYNPVAAEAAAAVQSSFASLPGTGTYMIPPDEAAWMTDHHAIVNYVGAGDSPSMAMAIGMGFVHFLLSALLIGYALVAIGGDFARQARAVLWFGFAAAVFMHLGDPIWYGFGWRNSLVEFTFDAVMFIAGGLVLARWFTSRRAGS